MECVEEKASYETNAAKNKEINILSVKKGQTAKSVWQRSVFKYNVSKKSDQMQHGKYKKKEDDDEKKRSEVK